MADSKVVLGNKNFVSEAKMRNHFAVIDVPLSDGGNDIGPTPVEYFLSSIGSCVPHRRNFF